jgi:hypothetical protein
VRLAPAALALAVALAAAGARGEDPKPAPPATPSPATGMERLGLKFTRDQELIITSDQAEGLKTPAGRESVVFTKHVKAHQGDMHLVCDWLEAIYPEAAAGRPDKIRAPTRRTAATRRSTTSPAPPNAGARAPRRRSTAGPTTSRPTRSTSTSAKAP